MPSPIEDYRSSLPGTWRLISFSMYATSDLNTPILKPHGDSPYGLIVFSSDSYMNATLTPRDRLRSLASDDWSQASDEDIAFISRGMVTYSGKWRLYEEDGVRLSTDVEIALNPNWIGKPQIRKVMVEQDGKDLYMTLRPVQSFKLPNGMEAVGILKWIKVKC